MSKKPLSITNSAELRTHTGVTEEHHERCLTMAAVADAELLDQQLPSAPESSQLGHRCQSSSQSLSYPSLSESVQWATLAETSASRMINTKHITQILWEPITTMGYN